MHNDETTLTRTNTESVKVSSVHLPKYGLAHFPSFISSDIWYEGKEQQDDDDNDDVFHLLPQSPSSSLSSWFPFYRSSYYPIWIFHCFTLALCSTYYMWLCSTTHVVSICATYVFQCCEHSEERLRSGLSAFWLLYHLSFHNSIFKRIKQKSCRRLECYCRWVA